MNLATTPSRTHLSAATGATGLLLLALGLWAQARYGDRLLPHSICITASQPLLWLHLLSGALVALAYLLIPLAILNFVRKRPDIPFGWVGWLFGAFIIACGITHAIEVWTLWYPVYWYAGVMKAFTAIVSLATAWTLYRLMPRALALPSAEQLHRLNRELEQEVATRRQVEAELRAAKAEVDALLNLTSSRARQHAAILQRFFDEAPLGLGVMDRDTRLLRVNGAMAGKTGTPADRFIGQSIDLVPGVSDESRRAARSVCENRQAVTGLEISRNDDSGRMRHFRCSFFPIDVVDSGEALTGFIVDDVTYEREVEVQLERALVTAEKASLAKDEFLAKVSHELRSPLQIAISSAEFLKRIPDLPAPAPKFVERVVHAVKTQARMINDLVDMSRGLSGKLHIDSETIDPALPLLGVLDHWVALAKAREVELDASGLSPGHALVNADPTRLEQIFANLVDNALRFSRPGGRVEIADSVCAGQWRLSVRDWGAGIAPENLQRLFEPFAQGGVQPEKGKGLGLGLAIVRSLAEAMKGRVWAESDGPGQGATFFVELPALGEHAAPASNGEEPEPRLDGYRLLYVEDEAEVAAAMQQALQRLGAQVEVATHYAQVAENLEGKALDAVVTDLDLGPGPSGFDVLRLLQRSPRHAHVPVVAVSAFANPTDRHSGVPVRFSAHLVKPVDARAVARTLLELLQPSGAAAS